MKKKLADENNEQAENFNANAAVQNPQEFEEFVQVKMKRYQVLQNLISLAGGEQGIQQILQKQFQIQPIEEMKEERKDALEE